MWCPYEGISVQLVLTDLRMNGEKVTEERERERYGREREREKEL